MTRAKLLLIASALFGAMLTSPLSAAQDKYLITGEIYSLTNTRINVDDIPLRLSPTVKVKLANGKFGRLTDLRIGDYIGIKMLTLGNKRLVDSIHALEDPAKP